MTIHLNEIPSFHGCKAVKVEEHPEEDTVYVEWEDGSSLCFDSNACAVDEEGNEWFWSGVERAIVPCPF